MITHHKTPVEIIPTLTRIVTPAHNNYELKQHDTDLDRLLLVGTRSCRSERTGRLVENRVSGNDYRSDKSRRRSWPKVLDLLLRSSHIGTSSVLFGGVVWAVPFVRLLTWHHLAIATGVSLIILNIWRSRHWPYQGRGVMAWLHIGLVWLVHVRPELVVPILVTALAVGVVGSHMPGALRHWSFVHRRRID